MAMTAGERKKILQQLDGDWYRLDRLIKDDAERSQFVWDVARDGLVTDTYYCHTLGNYYDPAHTKTAVAFLGRVATEIDDHRVHRGSKGWDHSFERLLTQIAQQDPKGLLAAKDELPAMFRDFSMLFLTHQGVMKGALPDSARRRLAIAWASSTWDEQWYSVRDSIPDDDWAALVLDAICGDDVAYVEWDRIHELADQATTRQAVQIIMKDGSQHARAHARTLFADLSPEDFPIIRQAIADINVADYALTQRRVGLALALITAYGRHEMDVPTDLNVQLEEDLAMYDIEDLDATLGALGALAEPDRERVLLNVLGAESQSGRRARVVASAAPTEAVLEKTIEAVIRSRVCEAIFARGLADFGSMAVQPLMEAATRKGTSSALAVLFIQAIDSIGAPEVAAELVELTGASTKGVRVAAAQALENLGADAIDAVRAGVEARKKAIRETCAALLAQLDLAGDNPLSDIEKRAQQIADPALDAVYEHFRTSSASSSEDYRKVAAFAEEHGLAVAIGARDYFLEKPEDWQRATVWRGLLGFLAEHDDVVWIAVDAFSRLPASMYSYYVDQQADVLRTLLRKHPTMGADALVFYLSGSPPAYRAQMLEMLLECRPDGDIDVYLGAMQDSSKVMRELGIQGIARLGADQLPAVLELLESRKKDIRLAAADALTRMPCASALTEIGAALEKEKTADVRTMLEQAVAAAGGRAFEFPANPDDAAVDAFLAELNQPKLPSFVKLASLELQLASGAKLSEEALHALIGRLMKEDPDNEDEVARWVQPFLDADSANALSVALKDAWASRGGESKDKWAIYQQAVLANEARLDQVAPRLDEMAGASNHHLAKWYLDVLYRHGSIGAHSWLAYWAKNGERSTVLGTARELLQVAADKAGKEVEVYARGLNAYIADDVADRQVPTLDLDQTFVVDYGERKFDVFMDQNHNLVIRDQESHKVTKSLPKPRKAETLDPDDKQHVSDLKKQLRRVTKEIWQRLEAGMVSGRPWTVAAFTELFGGHPIMSPFAGRLVFRADDGTLFRLSEGELLDADYDPVELDANLTVRVAHPLQMTKDELDRWGEHFAEAEILQPFDQLGRPVYDKQTALPTGSSTRGAVAGRLRRLGWRHGGAEDAGLVYTASRVFPGRGVLAWLSHGGFAVWDPGWEADEEIEVSAVEFYDLNGKEVAPSDVDPLAYSEIVLELTQLLA